MAVTRGVILCVAPRTNPPLLARWKGFEVFASVIYRGRAMNNLLLRALLLVFDEKTRDTAHATLATLLQDPNAAETQVIIARAKVRASIAVAVLVHDEDGAEARTT